MMDKTKPVYVHSQRMIEENCSYIRANLKQHYDELFVDAIMKKLEQDLHEAVELESGQHYEAQLKVIDRYCNKYQIFI